MSHSSTFGAPAAREMQRRVSSESDEPYSRQNLLERIKQLERATSRIRKRQVRHRRWISESESEDEGGRLRQSSRSRSSSRVSLRDEAPTDEPRGQESNPGGCQLDPGIESLLRGPTVSEEALGAPIHDALVTRWEEVLRSGLEEDATKQLLKKYPIAKNFAAANAPKLNAEIKGALAATAYARDVRLFNKQTALSTCLSTLGQALTSILQRGPGEGDKAIIESLSDTAQLIANVIYQDSILRRTLISGSIKENFRKTLEESSIDAWLYGGDLQERLVSAKLLDKSSAELKITTPAPKTPTTKRHQGNLLRSFRIPRRNERKPTMAALSLRGEQHFQPLRGGRQSRGRDRTQQTSRPVSRTRSKQQ